MLATYAGDNVPHAASNKILARLSPDELQRISVDLGVLPLKSKQVLHKQDEPIRHLYFPTGGVCSLIKTTHDGHAAEIVSIGSEGAVGTGAFFGQSTSPAETVVQMSCESAYVMPLEAFHRAMNLRGHFYNRVVRYNQVVSRCSGKLEAR